MKHTQGEWKVFSGQYPLGTISINTDVKTRICTLKINEYGNAKETKANAKLIAAAPDLLEALLLICSADPNDTEPKILNESEIEKIYAAIKKATA